MIEHHLLQATVDVHLEAERASLQRTYGWTELEWTVAADTVHHVVVVEGRFGLPSIVRRVKRGLSELIPRGWRVSITTVMKSTQSRLWPSETTPLWRDCGALTLATELTREDGPVDVLAAVRRSALVRAADGTIGWIEAPLRKSSPVAPRARRHQTWQELARRYAGVPYKEGGTTAAGIDCSGLAQRLYREFSFINIPRHSTDQLCVAAAEERPRHSGDLVFTRGAAGGPWHVGVALARGAEWSVLHASTSRRQVVEDPLELHVAPAAAVRFLAFAAIAEARRAS